LDFLYPVHVLDRRFAGDCFSDSFEGFVVDELVDVVTGCEGVGIFLCFVLRDPELQLSGYSGVEALPFAGEDVGVSSFGDGVSVWVGLGGNKTKANTEILSFAQNDGGWGE
jgi:hypothetical protein